MTQEKSVLIVSDRPDRAKLLARAITTILPCRCITGNAALPIILPVVAVIDVDGRTDGASAWAARFGVARVPCLVITNAPSEVQAQPSQSLRTVPVGTPRPAILSLVIDLVDIGLKRSASCGGDARTVEGRAQRACSAVADVFHAAQSGRRISAEAADAGTEVILEAVSESGIRAWLDTIARYDEQLYQHSLSVAGFAAAFGFSLKLPLSDQRRLAKAALLHDVGKSRIPRAILNKPEALTPAETAIMRTHAARGADLLAGEEGFDDAMLAVVRHHHEMLDGSGYPSGLSGDAIPDLVRLVTICDIHSALTERRAYRDPLPHDEAHAIMLGMTGKLDMVLLRAFFPIVRQSARIDAVA